MVDVKELNDAEVRKSAHRFRARPDAGKAAGVRWAIWPRMPRCGAAQRRLIAIETTTWCSRTRTIATRAAEDRAGAPGIHRPFLLHVCRVMSDTSAITASCPKSARRKVAAHPQLLGCRRGLALEKTTSSRRRPRRGRWQVHLERPCPCVSGVLVVISWPRPTIAQIMQMPLEQLQQYQLPFQ